MNNRILNLGIVAVLLLAGIFSVQEAKAQTPGDIDLSREYCEPYKVSQWAPAVHGDNIEEIDAFHRRSNWGFDIGEHPNSAISSIIITDKNTGQIVWEWKEDCSLVYKGLYKHLLNDYDKEAIAVPPGGEYEVEVNVSTSNFRSTLRVYYDNDESETFEEFDDQEYLHFTYTNGTATTANPPANFCTQYIDDGRVGGQWVQINRNYRFATYTFDWEPENEAPAETRFRFMADAQWVTAQYQQNACEQGWLRAGAANWGDIQEEEWGQVIDQTVSIVCPPLETFPNSTELLFAGELYNEETREPERGGPEELFKKPFAEFGSSFEDNTEISISIVGPLPSSTQVYQAADANGNIWQDVSPAAIAGNANFTNNNSGGITWKPVVQGKYEGSDNDFVTDALGNPLTDGSFNAAKSGSYALRIQARNASTKADVSCGFRLIDFSIKANRDIAVEGITSPRNYDEPFFRKYELQNPIPLEMEVRNIGLTDINEFVAKVEIRDPDGELYLEDEFNYDKDNPNQTILEIDDSYSVAFAKRFTPQEPGLYSILFFVESAEGNVDWDQSRFNNYLPRPTSGNPTDGYEYDNEYLVEIAYTLDLVGGEVLAPQENPLTDESTIIQNRPFRPIVRFLNNGINDATKIFADLEIRDENGVVVNRIEDFEIEDIPAGRFNFADITFPELIVREAGNYTLWARVDNVNEPFAVVDEFNEVTGEFTVESGISGVYTVGMMNAGDERNYNTITEAMNEVYFLGISGDVTFELTDQNYTMIGNDVAWDFRSAIIGLGYNENIDETYTMTWKPSANRSFIRGGVTVTLQSNGKGIAFGQNIFNETAGLAPITTQSTEEYIKFGGYVTFDGGPVKSLRFVMDSRTEFAAPFFLEAGTHNVELTNLLIENSNPTSHVNRVRLPLRSEDGKIAEFEDDLTSNNVNNVTVPITYSAGIALRATTLNLEDALEDNEDLVGSEFPIENIYDNSITGNEISDFGYGIMSLGIGGIYIENELSARYENYNNRNNVYSNNIIDNVGRAGIAIGNEEMSTIMGNTITNVNPLDVSNLNDGTGSYDHAGIMIGGLIYEISNDGEKSKGASAKDLIVNGNRINNVMSDVASYGIKVEQNYIIYDQDLAQSRLEMPDGPENILVANNVIQGLNATNMNADKFGIRLFTERAQFGDLLGASSDYPRYRTRNDKIVNNTIIIGSNMNNVTSNGNVFGLAIQQADDSDIVNNAIAITDQGIDNDAEFAAAVFLNTPLPSNGGPMSDYNAYYISSNSGAATVKLAETETTSNELNYIYSRNDFENLDQWSVFTGADENSIEYNFLNDLELTSNDVSIKMTNGQLPIGSKLNNRGKILSYLDNDKEDNTRGVTGGRYDIGAEEFNGRLYTSDVEMVRIVSPAAYKSTVVDPVSGNDFTGAEHIMTTAPINVTAQVRNDGSLAQVVDVTLTVSIESNTMAGEFNEFATFVEEATIASTNDVIVDFMLDQGNSPWVPETYSDYNNNGSMTDDYIVPARYTGMEANVTPRIRLEIQVGSDENNGNNTVSKEVRFYLTRTGQGIMVSTIDNNASLNPTISTVDELGGRLNTQQLRQGLLTGLNWRLNPADGDYDYDLLDRNGWERRSVNYDAYNVMFWADGGDNSMDNIDRFQIQDISNYLMKGTTQFKTNFITASQALATNIEAELATSVFGISVPNGNLLYPTSDMSYLNDPAWEVTGVGISEDRMLAIDNPAINPVNVPALDPMPIVVNRSTAVTSGRSLVAFTYDEHDLTKYASEPAMGVAYTTVTNNVVYLGAEWRHFDNITLLAQGLLDFINTNGGFVIPVELANFSANQIGDNVMVEWNTLSEENSSHFIVEKALESDEVFTSIKTVQAQGTKATETKYAPVIDENVEFGKTYLYKLKAVDIDGSWEYSETKDVTVLGNELTLTEVLLSPNPTNNGVTNLEFTSSNQGELNIEVYDMTGNLLLNQSYTVNVNKNTFTLDLGNVANGIYNVVITSGEYSVTKSLNVTK